MARRVAKNDYFEAAMALLAEDGYPALKQASLCKRLGVTTGSFYNHFGNWQAFTAQLLQQWREERTLGIREAAARASSPRDALLCLRQLALELPWRSEAAIRAWSLTDPEVASFQSLVDQERLDTVLMATSGMFTEPATALAWARTAIYVLIGFEQFETHPHQTDRLFVTLDLVLQAIDDASAAEKSS